MAYKKACVALAHQVGREMSYASAIKRQAYNSAAFYQTVGLRAKANQLRKQADKAFEDKKHELIQRMEVNGCL